MLKNFDTKAIGKATVPKKLNNSNKPWLVILNN